MTVISLGNPGLLSGDLPSAARFSGVILSLQAWTKKEKSF
jgi:hypothetical protein